MDRSSFSVRRRWAHFQKELNTPEENKRVLFKFNSFADKKLHGGLRNRNQIQNPAQVQRAGLQSLITYMKSDANGCHSLHEIAHDALTGRPDAHSDESEDFR